MLPSPVCPPQARTPCTGTASLHAPGPAGAPCPGLHAWGDTAGAARDRTSGTTPPGRSPRAPTFSTCPGPALSIDPIAARRLAGSSKGAFRGEQSPFFSLSTAWICNAAIATRRALARCSQSGEHHGSPPQPRQQQLRHGRGGSAASLGPGVPSPARWRD